MYVSHPVAGILAEDNVWQKGCCLDIISSYESCCFLTVCTLVRTAVSKFALQCSCDSGSLNMEFHDSCSHSFNGLGHGFDPGLTCTTNSLSAHFFLSLLRCLSVSIFFLALQLLLHPLLQSSYNPVDLILQAVAMEIMVISLFQCYKHCGRQQKRWLATDIVRTWGTVQGSSL